MTKRMLPLGFLTLFLAAAGCAHAYDARTASAGPTPNIGGDNIDPSSAQYNTDPAVAEPQATTFDTHYAAAPSNTGTGSGPQP